MKYAVIEMQNGNAEEKTWCYATRPEAEAKFHIVAAAIAQSEVARHTVVLMTDEGFVLDTFFREHGATGAE